MPLSAGTRLGPYEITCAVGAGGMGEVYRARDTRLDRTVAVKILPADFAADADRRQRFEREARVVASLSHPNVCALHDVGSAAVDPDGSPLEYLVMEYLEGETLADRLVRGPLTLAEVIRYGGEIAMALHAAHQRHIVHRDLKPGNVMLTRSGVKLLDFGLAKSSAPVFADGGGALSTHPASGVTLQGAVLGTLPYMAPEQVEGRPADWRSDIFALGAVLYEMATGRRAFGHGSAAAVASAILASNPPPLVVSRGLDRIISICLEKDPERRWQSAHDVGVQLAGLPVADAAGSPKAVARRSRLPWSVAAAALVAAAAALAWGAARQPASPGPPSIRDTIVFALPPQLGAFNYHAAEWIPFAVSPDGRRIAYSAGSADGRSRLWVRDLDSISGRVLEGTEGVTSMFWKPDGTALAFFAAGKLKAVDLTGGAPFTICDVRQGIGLTGTWGADGQILFASVAGDVLEGVNASGGDPVEVRRPDPGRGEYRVVWPAFLPDGRRYLYLAAGRDDTGAIMLAGPGFEPREVLKVKSNAQYVEPGYPLFVKDSTLVARRFDPATGAVSGDTIAIADRVTYLRPTGLAQLSASPNGVVAYHQYRDQRRIAAFDRTGREVGQMMPTGYYQAVRLSPDRRKILFDRMDAKLMTFDAWMFDLARGAESSLTAMPTTEALPIWATDDSIIYASVTGGAPRPVRRNLVTGAEQRLGNDTNQAQWPFDVSRDGHWFLFGQRSESGTFDILAQRLSDTSVVPFRINQRRASGANLTEARFSPDGRFVAYVSDETGRSEVLIAPFPSGAATPVSLGGGGAPRWSADARELFYIGADGELMTVPVRLTPSIEIGNAVRLFHARANDGSWGSYEAAPDGRFFAVVQTQVASRQPLTVIVNWPSSLPSR
jgi:Tol biopolymer transport system component